MVDKMLSADFETFMGIKDWKDYAGKWIAISNKKIVDSDEDIGKLIKKTEKRFKDQKPAFTKIPRKDSILV